MGVSGTQAPPPARLLDTKATAATTQKRQCSRMRFSQIPKTLMTPGRPSDSPTRLLTGCLVCGQTVPGRRRNGYCSDRCRLRHQKVRQAELVRRLLPDDPGRAE